MEADWGAQGYIVCQCGYEVKCHLLAFGALHRPCRCPNCGEFTGYWMPHKWEQEGESNVTALSDAGDRPDDSSGSH